MRNLKKFLALVMAMVMAFSLMLTVNAKDIVTEFSDRDQADPAFTEAVDVLSGMKVFQGDPEGTFRPASTITRAEVAALIYRLATGDVDDVRAGLYANYGNFADVAESDWFAGYVGYCANAGYIKGHGGYFNPYGQVTGYEVLAMVLRAAGYDKNHEFEGATWQTNVSALATQLQVLTDVKTTHYGNTLHLASRRDVVASLLFNTAYKVHMVEYTPIGGYNQYNNLLGEKLNPTLGKKYFGLANTTRIILGNQATGEGGTLLGVNSVKYTDANGVEQTLNTEYVYPGSRILAADAPSITLKTGTEVRVPASESVKLSVETGLDMFGHKVKVWYNEDDTATWKQTYATLDKTELTAIVHPTHNTDVYNTLLSDADPTHANLGIEARKAGFSVDLKNSNVYMSQMFGRILGNNYDKAAISDFKIPDVDKSTTSESKENHIYLLISNNKDKTVDVVVTLEAEVGQIARQDTTSSIKSLRLSSPDATATGNSKKSTFTSQGLNAGDIPLDSITKDSTTTLGSKVVGWRVTGTQNPAVFDGTDTDDKGPKGTNGKMPYFQLDNLPTTVTGTIQSINPSTGALTMSDGKVYEQSWFRYKYSANTDGDKVIGVDGTSAECFTVPASFQAGVSYTIALDNQGRWLGLTQAKNDFIYGTFADYEFGGLGSGSMKYAITGVNWDGEKVINSEFKSLNTVNSKIFPSGTDGDMGKGYTEALKLTRKFLGDNSGNTGNQIMAGPNTGYVLDSNGVMTDVLAGYATQVTDDWNIKASDVKNGFADLAGNGNFLATPNTKFIVVSGTGSDTLDVKVYTGISEFLNGSSWVTIDGSGTVGDAATGGPKSNTYFITEADRFNKWDTTANKQIASVIMDLRDVQWSDKTNLYYAADKADATGVTLAGADAADGIQQFELYKDGVKGYYFVQTNNVDANVYSPTAGSSPVGGTDGKGRFYTLIQIKTVNNTPVYKAIQTSSTPGSVEIDQVLQGYLSANGVCNTDLAYAYIGVSNLSTAQIGGEVFSVSNAKVVDLDWTQASGRDKIESVLDLNNAISGGYTTIKVAIVNDGVNVSTIYVTSVTTTLT